MKGLMCILVKPLYILAFFALMTVFVYANAAKADMVADGLVAYWSLDADTIKGDKVKDIIGENEGVIKGKVVQVAGKINGALEFDGTSSVDVEGTDALNFNGKEDLSVCVWAKATSDEPVVGVVVGCCGTIVAQRDANGWAFRYDGRNPGSEYEFIVCPNWQGDGGFGAPGTGLKKGEWHYLTGIVEENKKMYVYLDGELVIEGPFSGPISSVGPETDIGHASDGGFIGAIDEVAIYDRALTEAEVIQNFKSTRFFAVDANGKLAICWGEIKK